MRCDTSITMKPSARIEPLITKRSVNEGVCNLEKEADNINCSHPKSENSELNPVDLWSTLPDIIVTHPSFEMSQFFSIQRSVNDESNTFMGFYTSYSGDSSFESFESSEKGRSFSSSTNYLLTLY